MTSAEESSQMHFPDKTADRLSDNTELQQLIQDLTRAVEILPPKCHEELWNHPEFPSLIELVIDYGRRPLARFPTGDFPLSETSIDFNDLDFVIESVGEFGDDNRTGIEGTLHRVSCMRDRHDRIYGLTIRIGRAVTTGTAGLVIDPLAKGQSVLLLGPPGVGKTTAIRSFCRLLADDLRKRVVIVDTSNEIAGHGLIPHPAVGSSRRMHLKHRADQHHVMVEAVQNHMPEVIVIDEIGKKEECQAAKSISQRGVQLLATAHARTLEDVIKDPVLRELVGGISNVIIGDGRARRTKSNKKTVPERANASSFNVIVEMADRTRWRIHYDANSAVDAILAGYSPRAEIRYLDIAGNMFITNEFQSSYVFGPFSAGLDNASISAPLNQLETTSTSQQVILGENGSNDVNLHNTESATTNTASRYSEQLEEAKRILNASSYFDAFQVRGGSTKEELDVALAALRMKLAKTANEDKIIKEARSHVHKIYRRLLPAEEKEKIEQKTREKKERREMKKKQPKEQKAGASTKSKDTISDMPGAITVEKWVVDI